MTKTPDFPLAQLTRHAIHVLAREMGVVNTMRFLNQFVTGSGNYTQERDILFKDLSLDDVLSQVRDSPAEPSR